MITLRRHQIEAVDTIEAAWRAGTKRPLVDACVSAGKSYMIAETIRREIERGGRALSLVHTRELVEQNANAMRAMGIQCGINAAALRERTWRGPAISAAIQSVFRNARAFGPVSLICIDESHLLNHSQNGMYHEFLRGFPDARIAGFSGTVYRLQGGSLVEGEGAPFDKVVYVYSLIDGIRDGYLVPAFSIGATEKIDPTKLRTAKGEFTNESQDSQTIAQMDNHLAQMVAAGQDRRGWLVFEASVKAAIAMAKRMNEWGIPTGLVLGETPACERAQTIDRFRRGELRALVNRDALTTGFDVPHIDMLVMRRATKSLGLYVQMTGRLLRTIGGNIESSKAAGKTDGIVLDFAGNIDRHGPLDFIRAKETKAKLVSCESCGKRNASAATKCWSCGATMLKNCPACLESIPKYMLDCPHCGFDMRREETAGERAAKLLETPSGAALIASYKTGTERQGGWIPVRRAWQADGAAIIATNEGQWALSEWLGQYAQNARWIRLNGDAVGALLLPNGTSRSNAWQVNADRSKIIVPLPGLVGA